MKTYEEFRSTNLAIAISELDEYKKEEPFGDIDNLKSVMDNDPIDIIEWLVDLITSE